jgi:SAM-dependent methyltransferase
MSEPASIRVFDSQGEDYHRAFQVFLDHTDQKARAKDWLTQFVQRLPRREVFLDVGAGNGKVTAWLTEFFQHTIALEPNPFLRDELVATCGPIEVLSEPIETAQPSRPADFALCSHVFYYLPQDRWLGVLDRLVSWLGERGTLAVVLQNHGSDCMAMLDHFLGQRFNLTELGRSFAKVQGERCELLLETVPAYITTSDLATAYTVAEFMMNLLPLPKPPTRDDVERYVREHFGQADGGYRFSCHQDFLQVRRRN